MKKTIYCLVQPQFYPVKDMPSIEESISISHHLLTKHCVTVGGFFDNRYESIQEPKDVDRDAIFRLSYKKRLPTLVLESSLSYIDGIDEIVGALRNIISKNPMIDRMDMVHHSNCMCKGFGNERGNNKAEFEDKRCVEKQDRVGKTRYSIIKDYIASDHFKDDVDKWLESTDLKKHGTEYKLRYISNSNNSVNTKNLQYIQELHAKGIKLPMHIPDLNIRDLPSDDGEAESSELAGLADDDTLNLNLDDFLADLSFIYKTFIKSERSYVKDINLWLIMGASSKLSVEDHQHIEPIKDRDGLVELLGQIYKARKIWVIPYEVEYN